MRRCAACAAGIEGEWDRCPLCGAQLFGHPSPDPLPSVPLRFSRRRLLRILVLVSLALIALSFVVQLWLGHRPSQFGAERSVWLGVCTMWLVTLMAVRGRRHLARGTLQLVVVISLVCTYWDYLTGWNSWSLSFAVPIVCACAIVALAILEQTVRHEAGEHVVYGSLTAGLGIVPIVFLLLGWVTTPIPSAICVAVALLTLAMLFVERGGEMRHEFGKRLHL
ncbi:hypothetical protein DEO23_12580 [Brachybacterium endophyticum]|uniref:Zinc ribbon domain-containing protein n=1 Tax=Brachybacterium endophyticum TaxID=2182385 RepID=A0A2U2RHR5_9MICO|nr:DUF6320 domain-containing protein [Brachybacterium endophyticum]PWH05413.1 hypothetical protein DEO23_12580 [Brachybacterium endophyticum]